MKPWYKSRTLWVNFLAVAVFVLQGQFGFVLSPEIQAAILALMNFFLRLDTSKSIEIP